MHLTAMLMNTAAQYGFDPQTVLDMVRSIVGAADLCTRKDVQLAVAGGLARMYALDRTTQHVAMTMGQAVADALFGAYRGNRAALLADLAGAARAVGAEGGWQ